MKNRGITGAKPVGKTAGFRFKVATVSFGCRAVRFGGNESKDSKKKSKNTVDERSEAARVSLPLITADSQESEWFCEHRVSECLEQAKAANRSRKQFEARLARRFEKSPSFLTVWFSEFQAAGPKHEDGKI